MPYPSNPYRLLPLLFFLPAACTTTAPTNTSLSNPDTIQTKKIQLHYADAPKIAEIARTLYGVPATADPTTNTLLVRAAPDTCDEILELATDFDKVATEDPYLYVYPLKHAHAADLAITLQSMIDKNYFDTPKVRASTNTAVVPYPPLNALLITSSVKADAALREMLNRLDIPTPNPLRPPE